MTEGWTFIDGVRVSVPLSYHDAVKFGWHKGADIRRFPTPNFDMEMAREVKVAEWCKEMFDRNTYTWFHDSVWFYREEDAVLCQLRWS